MHCVARHPAFLESHHRGVTDPQYPGAGNVEKRSGVRSIPHFGISRRIGTVQSKSFQVLY